MTPNSEMKKTPTHEGQRVPARDFVQKKTKGAGQGNPKSEIHKLLYAMWVQAMGPTIILPVATCTHNNTWHILDMNLAACITCGCAHSCESGTCPSELNDDGHEICQITACIIKPMSYGACDFRDTAGPMVPINQVPKTSHRYKKLGGGCQANNPCHIQETVTVYISEAISGEKWKSCVMSEMMKGDQRRKNSLYRFLRLHKMESPGVAPNLCKAACNMVQTTGKIRVIEDMSLDNTRHTVEACASPITKTILMINQVCPGAVPEIRIRHFTFGLLYLMRNGVIMNGVVVLPKFSWLTDILPQENSLGTVFGVKSKCITETENLVKSTLRNIGAEKLQALCIHTIDRVVKHF